jgi:tetratricopeptide (TPR) repeat protein
MNRELDELIRSGRIDDALARATARLQESKASGDAAAQAAALLDEACAQRAHGDNDDAVITVDDAIWNARRTFGAKDPRYAEALELGAEIAADAGMPNAADARFRAAIEVLEGSGVRGHALAHAMYHHALFRRSCGDIDGAVRALLGALERSRETSDADAAPIEAMALTALGSIALDAGRHTEARELGARALEIWVHLRQARRFEVADAMALVGRAALRQNDARAAADFLEPACEIYRLCKVDVRERHATAARDYARALDALGRKEDARAAYRRALDLYCEGDEHRMEIEQRLLELARS